jgi:hypothetical protein
MEETGTVKAALMSVGRTENHHATLFKTKIVAFQKAVSGKGMDVLWIRDMRDHVATIKVPELASTLDVAGMIAARKILQKPVHAIQAT